MCRFKSYVVTKDLKVHGSLKTCSHAEILDELELQDSKDQNAILMREYVQIEVYPKNSDVPKTRNLADWIYHEDEPGTLPEWYIKNKERIQEAVFLQLTTDLKLQLVLNGESLEFTDRQAFGYGSSTMVGHGSSTMVGYDSSKMVGYGSSKMVGYDSSTMVGYDSSTMVGYGSSTMVGYDSSTMEIKSETSVALCNGKIFVHKKATVIIQEKIDASKV
jgi:hypothetical protein